MQRLPTEEEQDWLVEALAGLIGVAGPSHFVSMPIVLPTAEYFPEPWEAGPEGLDRVTRRLMQYASLDELEPEIALFSTDDLPQYLDQGGCRSIAGVFLGIDDHTCRFAFNAQNPVDGPYAAAVMAHEVAHAFRAHHKIARGGDEEELLTDVTAAYLGFGILGANASYRFRTSGDLSGAWASHSWSVQSSGYIPPQAFSYLLALQFSVRATPPREVTRALAHLELNQRDFTRAAMDACGDQVTAITHRLGLPPRQQWPPAPTLGSIQRPLPALVAQTETEPLLEVPVLVNSGRPVFRIRRTATVRYAFWLGVLAAGVGVLVGLVGWDTTRGSIAAFAGVAGGIAWGHRKQWDVCSDQGCTTWLAPALTTCPGCGGSIAGRIRDASDRLEAEEAWRNGRRVARRNARARRGGS